jgi:hypothetical protein
MGWRDFQMNAPVHYVHKVHKEAPDTPLIGLNVLTVQGDGIESGPTHSSNRGKSIEEATELYKKRGWIQIFSCHLIQSIYLVKNDRVKVPDPSIPKYTQVEIEALKGLNLEELMTLHDAKRIFGGTIHEK